MFAEVFDGLDEREGVVFDEDEGKGGREVEGEGKEGGEGKVGGREEEKEKEKPSWDTTKRVLLATVEEDSTVVYYVVHDGIVKPRQN